MPAKSRLISAPYLWHNFTLAVPSRTLAITTIHAGLAAVTQDNRLVVALGTVTGVSHPRFIVVGFAL